MTNNQRPNRHSNPSSFAKTVKSHHGRYQFIQKKKRETKELLKAVLP